MITPGKQPPAFSLKDQDGVTVKLKDLWGKWTVLYFYPKDDTPGCTKQACGFSENLVEFQSIAKDCVVLGVSPDSVESHKKFVEKYDLSITLLSDPDKKVLKAYDAWGMKKNYGKEYEGGIRSTFIIDPEGVIQESMHNVRATGHVERVLKRMKEMTA